MRRARFLRRVIVVVVVVSVGSLGLPSLPAAAITQANEITYVYDELGRLEAVVDPTATNGIATYTYDNRGNLLSIGRQSATTTSILDFHPKTAKRSTTVTIYGAGFSSTPGDNTVKFGGPGGTVATVTSATTTQLAVTVPDSGSVDGAIYVSSPSGSSTSTQQFALDTSAAPTITGFTPTSVNWDVDPPPTVTISGTGFDPSSPKANNVFFNGIRAEVTAATSTSLTVVVPPFNVRGRISVRTSYGEATSTDDFVATQVNPSQLETVTRTALGTPTTLSITSQGHVSLALFDGAEGQRIFLDITNSTTTYAVMAVTDPFGRIVASTNFGSGGGFIDTMTLPMNGTYSAVLTQGGTSYLGSATFTITEVPTDLSGTLTPGTPVSGSITAKGQNANYTFSGSTNQQATVTISGSTIWFGYFQIRFSDGGLLASTAFGSTSGYYVLGPVTLPKTDTYTVLVDPYGRNTGNFTVTLSLSGGGGAPSGQGTRPSGTRAAQGSSTELDPSKFEPGSTEAWVPTDPSRWVSDRSHSPFEFQTPLRAPRGITALSGTVLRLDGAPLPGVTLRIGARTTTSDPTGRFLLARVHPGDQVLEIDGTTASTAESTYGRFEAPVSLKGGRTTALGFTIWMPKLDTDHAVHVDSPTTREVVVDSPLIPGLKLVIPKGSVIRDEDGDEVDEITITPIPIDRTPYPLFTNPTMYFTIQPEGAEISPYGARLIYPNYQGLPPGRTVPFMIHEADEGGWESYGSGKVSPNGSEIVPSRYARLHQLTGSGNPLNAWIPATLDAACYPQSVSPSYGVAENVAGRTQPVCGGDDPVDSSTGLFSHARTDLRLPGPMPIELTRFYRPLDIPPGSGLANDYMFGRMMQTNYESYLYNPDITGTSQQYVQMDLLMPGDRRVHYTRTSLGTDFQNAVLEATQTPGPFHKSTIRWDNNWVLTRRDGTVYSFGFAPVLKEIRDRFGNRVMVMGEAGSAPNPTSLSAYNPITHIASYPSGRWITLKYTGKQVTEVKDDLGRSIKYTYGSLRQLLTVVDANQSSQPNPKPTTYTWNSVTGCGQVITAVTDPRNIRFLSNTYDGSCRVTDQFVPIGTPGQTDNFHFAYTVDGQGKITQTDITDPNGNVTRTTFDATGSPTSQTDAFGTPSARTFTYAYDPTTHRTTSVTDSFHSRRTDFGYNPSGDLTSVTRLAGTPSAVTTNYTYDPAFHQLQTITDPLEHTTRIDYDAKGCLDILTDPMSRQTLFDCNGAGQITSVTDPQTHQTQFAYAHGDLTTVTDPLNRITSRFTDAGGRVLSVTDPLNYVSAYAYDALNELTKLTDAKGRVISFLNDEDGNLVQVKDERNASPSTTNFAYNDQNLVSSRTDPLGHTETFTYDNNGNLNLWTDRKGQVTEFRYDPLDQLTFAGFKRTGSPPRYSYESTITYTYDVGGRLTQIADTTTGAGTITRTYDDLDRITNEKQVNASNQGVSSTYDTDSTRATMTVQGATQVSYGYNNAAQLTSVTQGSASVGLSYFSDGRLHTLLLKPAPNPISQTYAYDPAGEVSSITYAHGGATDDLSYAYDPTARRTAVYGTFARTGLPAATTQNATYDAANRLLSWNGTSASSDSNGNLTGDGTFTYVYNARNQLTTAKQGSTTLGAYVYDGLGRRVQKTSSSVITKVVYDSWNVAQEKDSKNKITFNELEGLSLDQVFSRNPVSGSTSYLLTDALGSTVGLADTSGVVGTSYTYEPFGRTAVSGASSTNPFGFTGRENDATGSLALYNYRARSYSPTLQRFLTEDPVGFADDDSNLYTYVGNGATYNTDPTGTCVINDNPCPGANLVHWFDDQFTCALNPFSCNRDYETPQSIPEAIISAVETDASNALLDRRFQGCLSSLASSPSIGSGSIPGTPGLVRGGLGSPGLIACGHLVRESATSTESRK
jgi:RHS repeat-associated protein